MPPKPPLDKQCWKWAETTEPGDVSQDNVRTAYRLNLNKCRLSQCKRQCKGNPYCLNCIGEKVWFGEIQDASWHDIRDPNEERRDPDMFVGLKNLGATCYVNTFLQLWFHNEKVKRGIYKWRPVSENTGNDWKPSSVCSHLQVIFGLLEISSRRYVDPIEFIQHLGLDAGQQQDAQEFSKLFLTVLEENMLQTTAPMSPRPLRAPGPRNVIQEQFCGSYAYVTRCSGCNSASERQSEFYELDLSIQGHKTLDDSLKGFLEVEKLEGDNQYMCSTCNRKQNATRAIELKRLPPVLNLQLLRFVFEIKTGSKKKLSSIIQFPDTLDMTGFLPAGESAVYDLTAVLIHRGPSAYSGHYVAHIKGKDSQAWYKFNDEEIEKIKGKNLKLGNEEDLETKQKKSVRTPKGYHSSKNAYMLVYTKQTAAEMQDNQTNCVSVNEAKGETAVKAEATLPEKGDSANTKLGDTANVQAGDIETIKLGDTANVKLLMNDTPVESGNAGASMSPKLESKDVTLGEEAPISEIGTMHTSPKKTCLSPKKSPKKSEPIISSKSEMLDQHVSSTVEIKAQSQSLQDCTISTTASTSATPSPLLCKPGPSKEKEVIKAKEPVDHTLLPKHVIDYVEKDNESFEKWVQEMTEMKNKNIATGREKQETVKMIFQELALRDSPDQEAFEWLPMSWLSKWLNDPNTAPPVDITGFLCSHGKICPDQSVKMKCVSRAGADQLYNIYGGNIRLFGEESLCNDCVKNKCNLIRTKLQIAEDDKFITKEMKTGIIGKKCFWIGKGSSRSWRRLAMERLGDAAGESEDGSSSNTVDNCNGNNEEIAMSVESSKANDAEVNMSGDNATQFSEAELEEIKKSDPDKASVEDGSKPAKEKEDEDETLQFNEDLLCEVHQGLDPDIACRKLIPETVWLILKKYFPGCPEFDDGSVTCEKCQSSREQENELKLLTKQAAAQQKAALSDLFHDRKRPSHVPAGSSVFVVSTDFISQWRQFVREPARVESVSTIRNELLLCEHGGYLYLTPGDNALKSDDNVTYLLTDEWRKLREFYAVDQEIEIVCLTQEDKQELITMPEICEECLQTRLSLEESEIFDYVGAVLYVRKHQKVEAELVKENFKDDFEDKNPEFESKAGTNGRKRSSSGSANNEEPPDKFVKSSENGKSVRKSQRHRRARGEREISVSSKDTLKDLKVQIMRLFSVPPFDQNLYIKGRKLKGDNSNTLGDLRIAPGTVIDLVADEVEGDPVILEELHKESGVPEAGFKGTNLLSS